MQNFLSTLKAKAEREALRFPHAFNITRIRSARTIGEFDDAYIAPIYGFEDKLAYYRATGSKWWLHRIRSPVIAINARDDPFIEEASLPTAADLMPLEAASGSIEAHPATAVNAVDPSGGVGGRDELRRGRGRGAVRAPVRLIYHSFGGHCGFFTRQLSMNSDSRLASSKSSCGANNNAASGAGHCGLRGGVERHPQQPVPAHGWLAEELARAIHHMHHSQHSQIIPPLILPPK